MDKINYSTVPRSGLVLELPVDGNANTTVGTNGTATNVTWVDSDVNYVKQCASFNGISSVITISSLNLGITNTYTMNWLWKCDTLPTTGNLYNFFIKGNTTTALNGFDCALYNNGGTYQLYMTHSDADGGTSVFWNITPTAGKWYDFTITYSSNSISLYSDGNLISSQTLTRLIGNATNNMYLGYNGIANIRRLNGNISFPRIYNRALSQDEITNLYQEGLRKLGPTNTPPSGNFPAYSLANLEVGKVLEISKPQNGGVYYDQSGNGNNSTSVTSVTDSTNGLYNMMNFNGSSSYISIPDSSSLDITGSVTLVSTFKINSAVNYAGLFYKGTDTGGVINYCIDLGVNGLTPRFFFTSPSNTFKVYQSNMTLEVGKFYTIVATHTFGAGVNTKIYINGVDRGGSWVFGTGNESAVVNNENLYIGRIYPLTIYSNTDILLSKVYNRAFSSTEAQQLYYSSKII